MTRPATAEEILDAWTAQLTAAGWTHQSADIIPGGLPTLRHLLDPSGRIQARARVYSDTNLDVELRCTASQDGGDRPAWYVIAGWLQAPVVIAAAAAAADSDSGTGTAAGDLLIRAGWRLERYEAFTPTWAEYQWASADDTRWACFTAPDTDPDGDGNDGWILGYPGPDGYQQRITASAGTPAALLAALALSA